MIILNQERYLGEGAGGGICSTLDFMGWGQLLVRKVARIS